MVAEEGRQCVVSVGWLSISIGLGAILFDRSFFQSDSYESNLCVCVGLGMYTYT